MGRRITRRGSWGLLWIGLFAALLAEGAMAQAPHPTRTPRPKPIPATQPADERTEEEKALERLLQLQKQAVEAEERVARTQPSSQPAESEAMRRLRELQQAAHDASERALRERIESTQPATPSRMRPVMRGPAREQGPSLEERRRLAQLSTRRSGPGVLATRPGGEGMQEAGPSTQPEAGGPESLVLPELPGAAGDEAEEMIPPPMVAEPAVDEAPEGEWFNFDHMPWEDVVRFYARKIGKPLMGEDELIIGGELTYRNSRIMTKEEALDELNLLLHEKGYRFVEHEHHIYVVTLAEMPQYVEVKDIFATVEAFQAAAPRDMDYVVVYIDVKDRPAKQIVGTFNTSLPDYALLSEVGDTNQIKIQSLARDVRKLLALMGMIDIDKQDPRQTRYITIKTNVRDIERMVREMFELGGGSNVSAALLAQRLRARRGQPEPEAEIPATESEIIVTADERTNTLIVKGTLDQLNEIQEFVEKVDQKPDIGKFDTHVIEIEHGNAADIANLLNQIFQQEQGDQTPAWQRLQQLRRMQQQTPQARGRVAQAATPSAAPADLLAEGAFERAKKTIRLVADERTNSLVVYANEEGLQRVEKMLEVIDKPLPDNFQTYVIKNAAVEEVYETVNQVLQGLGGAAVGAGGLRRATVILDAPANSLHVLADRETMQRVERIIAQIDVEGPARTRHVIELVHLEPSAVAARIEELLSSGTSGSTAPSPLRFSRRGRMGRMVTPQQPAALTLSTGSAQIIPLDEAKILIVICTDEEWAQIEETIKMWDERFVSDTPEIRSFEIQQGDPNAIAAKIQQFFRTYTHPTLGRSTVEVATEGNTIYAQGVRPALDEIAQLIAKLDVDSSGNPLVILPLAYADATQVAEQAQGLLPPGAALGGRRMMGNVPGGPMVSLQADTVTNSLIIQADPLTVERVKGFAAEMDQKVAEQQPERRYYALKNAPARDVQNAINQLFSGTAGSFRGSLRRGPVGTQITTVIVGSQVVVDAPAAKQAEIAALVEQLDAAADQGITTVLVKLPGSNVGTIAQHLMRAFQDRVRDQSLVARFEADPTTETILMTCSRDVLPEAEALLSEYKELGMEQIWQTEFRQLKNATADEASRWLLEQLVALASQQVGSSAARQIRVTGDMRTNRVIINAPQVVVKQGLLLLDQYDQPAEVAIVSPVEVWTVKLAGLDVNGLSQDLQRALDGLPKRPDRLRAIVTADQLTSNLIISAPTDMKPQIDELIAKFTAETADLLPEQRMIEIKNADAAYIAGQVNAILNPRISRLRGQGVAQQVSIIAEPRLNRVVVNAPKFAVEMAEALITELDQPPIDFNQIQTIPLEHADANTMLGVVRTIFDEKIRARTLQISVEPLTNSLIVGATKEDFAEIEAWVKDLDNKSIDRVSPPVVIELQNANPWEIYNVLNQTYSQKSLGRRVPPGQEIKISIIANRSLVVQAPPDKLKEIQELAAQLDAIGANELIVRKYRLAGMGAQLPQLAGQIQNAVNQQMSQREQRINVTAVPAADTLIVTATEEQMPQVERYMEEFKDLFEPPQIETIRLQYADANAVFQALQRVYQSKVRAGQLEIGVEPLTNSLVVSANTDDLTAIRTWSEKFDESFKQVVDDDQIITMELQFADPWEVRNMINDVFAARGSRAGQSKMEEVYVTVSNNTLIVKAPPRKREQIRELIAKIDAEDSRGLTIKTYDLKVLNAGQVAAQVQMYLRAVVGNTRRGQMQPGAFAEPTTNTLVVIAPAQHLGFIDTLVADLDSKTGKVSEPQAYELTYASAEQIAPNVQAMLQAKVTEREGASRQQQVQIAVSADGRTNRLMVFAPDEYQQLAADLVKMLDEDVEVGELVHIIPLEQADAKTLADTLNQTLAGQSGGFSRRAGSGSIGGAARQVRVIPDAASNSIVVAGLPKDVAFAESLIKDLEINSEQVPEIQIFQLKYSNVTDIQDALGSIFPSARNAADTVTITGDDYYNRLIVTANKRKMRQVEAYIGQLDAAPPEGEEGFGSIGGKQLYFVDVYRGDASDIVWEMEGQLPPEDRGGPNVEADWFGEYIKVTCRESEFPHIEKLIREIERRIRVEEKVKIRTVADPSRLIPLLQARYPDVPVKEAQLTQERPTIVEKLRPDAEPKAKPASATEKERAAADPPKPCCFYMPLVHAWIAEILAEADALQDPQQPPASQPAAAEAAKPVPARSRAEQRGTPAFGRLPDEENRRASQAATAPQSAGDQAASGDEKPKRERATITILPDNRVVIAGPENDVDNLDDAIDLMSEDLALGEVIRIFEFSDGDVNAAAQILDRMFNERQIAMPQRQPQQQPDQRGRGERGEGGEREQQGALEQLRGMIGGRAGGDSGRGSTRGGQRVRIATDPGHNYLIVKCDEADLPEIRQLLRELDIPPGKVDVQVFQLRNLDAAETAENIKDVLGINKAQSSRGRDPFAGQRGAAGGNQQALMQMLQQQLVSIGGVEGGAKVEQVEIIPNTVTNSLMVSAPPEVMKLIEEVITELEELEGFDRIVIRHYPLQKSRVDDILPLLQDIFGNAAGSGGGSGPRRGRAAAGGGGGSPADLGPVTISGDPRTNTIIYTAEAKDVETVEAQIRMLDIGGSINEAELYVCENGDAEAIAGLVSAIFAPGGGAGRGRGGAAATAVSDVRIEAEASTNTIMVWGPPDKRELIFAKIRELDQLNKLDIREIPVVHADPEDLAAKLIDILGGRGGTTGGAPQGNRGRGVRGSGGAQSAGRVVIVGDYNARKLLVRAPDPMFKQILELVQTLDHPSQLVQIRRFELQHAQADAVVDSVKQAMTEFMQLQKQSGKPFDMDAFTAVADPRTNCVVVVGSPATFAFVENVLAAVDVETPADQQREFRVFTLDRVDAETVAAAINDFASGSEGGAQQGRPGGRRGAGAAGAVGTMAAGEPLVVQAVAEPNSNSVLVFGRAQDIDIIERAVIGKLEESYRLMAQIASVPVKNVPASQLVSLVQQFMGGGTQDSGGSGSGRSGRSGAPSAADLGPQLVPNDEANIIVVRGSQREIDEVRDLVERFDSTTWAGAQVKVIPVPYGENATDLANMVERVVNDGEADLAEMYGRRARRVTVGANEFSKSLIVYGDATMFGVVESMVNRLAEIGPSKQETIIIELTNLSPEAAVDITNNLQSQRGGGTGGSYRPGSSSRSRGSTPGTSGGSRRRTGRGGGGATFWPMRPELPVPRTATEAAGSRTVVSAFWLMPALVDVCATGGLDKGRQEAADVAAVRAALRGNEVAVPRLSASDADHEACAAIPELAAPRGRAPRASILACDWQSLEVVALDRAERGVVHHVVGPRVARQEPVVKLESEALPRLRPPARPQRQFASLSFYGLGELDEKDALMADDDPPAQEKPATRPARREAQERPRQGARPSNMQRRPQPPATQPATRRARPIIEKLHEDQAAGRPTEQTKRETPQAEQRARTAGQRPAAAGQEPAASQPPAAQIVPPPGGVPQTQPQSGVDLSGVTGTLRGDVTAVALDSRRVMIAGDAQDLEFIRSLLAQMDQDWPEAMIEVFTLKAAKAEKLAPILSEAIENIIRARTSSPGPADQFSISAEARSNSLIVAASEVVLAQVESLIDKLDIQDEGGDTQFRAVPLIYVRALEAVAQIKPVLEQLNRIRDLPTNSQPSVQADDRSNSIVVIGTPGDIDEIERLIHTIDVELTPEQEQSSWAVGEMQIVNLQNALAEDLAKVLTDMIEEEQQRAQKTAGTDKPGDLSVRRLRLITADGQALPELNLERPIRIVPEKGTNSLIVYSSRENNESLKAIISTFDSLPLGADTDVRAFALQYAKAEHVAEVIEKVINEGKGALRRPAEGEGNSIEKGVLPPMAPGLAAQGLPFNVIVAHDVRSNTVFVVGRKNSVLLAAGLIQEIDKSSRELGVRPFVLELKKTQASTVAEKLTEMLEKRAEMLDAKDSGRDNAVLIPDDRSNSLVVLATQELFDMIEELTLQLDSADRFTAVDSRYRRLDYGDAQKLQALLQEVFDRKIEAESKAKTETQNALYVTADARSNSLVLTGTRDYLDEAGDLIDELDQKFDPTVEFRVRAIKLNSAVNVAALLKDMIDKALTQSDSKLKGTPIHVAADPLSDSLLLAASHEDMVMLERWVEVLDRPSELGRMTRIVPMGRGNAETLSKSVADLYQKSGEDGELEVTVTFDNATNSVIAHGPPAVLDDLEALVRELDEVEAKSGAVVRIFPLEQAYAEDAAELLDYILQGQGGLVGGAGGSSRGGAGGSREDAARQVVLIWQEQHADANVATLKAMRDNVVVIGDLRTNSLVVLAPLDSMPLMESLVRAIDVPPQADNIRLFPLRNADAADMVEMLRELFEERTTSGGGGGGSRGTTGEAGETQLVIEGGFTGEGGRQRISFTSDARTNSIVAAGTKGYLDLVEELVLELDTQPIDERKTMVYSPRNIVAADLATSIRDYSDQEQQRLQDLGEEISTQRRMEREITAIASEEANRIILAYSPRYESDVFDIVRELDQPPLQVMIQVLIVEVSMDNSLELGVEFAFQDLQFTKAGPTDTTTFDYVGGTDIGAAGSGLGGFTFTVSGSDFNFLFRTLQNEGSLNVLSRPQIVAMDNQTALIDISDDVPYVTGTSTSIAGQITTQVARERIGIKLEVTPQINPDGFVRMEINQEVSDFTGSTVDVGQGVTAPVFFRRQAQTTVTVKDNETIVLGGLITSREERREQKIPILGDIPGLGLLFSNRQNDARKSELLVILTPRVIRTIEDYRELSIAERDRTGLMSEETLTSPLMNGLRVQPEELPPAEGEPLLGPFPNGAAPENEAPAEDDEYGPPRPKPARDATDPAADTYDVPVTLRSSQRVESKK